jgi:cytochrome c oxidase subunit 2
MSVAQFLTFGSEEGGGFMRLRLRVRYQLCWTLVTTFLLGLMIALPVSFASARPSDGITNIFKPLSTPAEAIHELSLLVLIICAAIFLLVGGLLTYTLIRFRRRPDDDGREPPQVYGSNQIELAWTVIPILIVFVLILVTARTIADIQHAARPADALDVTIIGHQWWWEIHYPELGIVTANELHIPVSEPANRRPTFLKLKSADVGHSFWVPQLAGKTDAIPNRENRMWIEPKQPGIYLGNCAEYCGTQHARMLLRVIVHLPDDFVQWVAAQQRPPVDDPRTHVGRDVFFATACVNCHAIQGTPANGTFGPDLTHLMSRATLASGAVPNTPENLRAWVRDPQTLKEGSLMPNMQLTETELDHIVMYLLTLR